MHLFDLAEADETQRRFWTVFGAVSGLTYLAAVTGLLSVSQRANTFKQAAMQWLWPNKPSPGCQAKASSSHMVESGTETWSAEETTSSDSEDTTDWTRRVGRRGRRPDGDSEQSSQNSDDSRLERRKRRRLERRQDDSHIRSGSVSNQPAIEVLGHHRRRVDDHSLGESSRFSWLSGRKPPPTDEEKGKQSEEERGRHLQDPEKVSGEEYSFDGGMPSHGLQF